MLLVVGGADDLVLELNREAAGLLRDARLEVVSGATHMFPEPGTLEQVAKLATDFLARHLSSAS